MIDGYDYRYYRSGRDYYDEPHYRSRGGAHEEPHYHGYGRSYYDLSHRGCDHGGYYEEPYGGYDYGHNDTATALASLITGAAMRADTVSLTTVAHTGAAPSITASLSASAMRSGRGSEMRRLSGGIGVWTRCVGGCTRVVARAVTGVPTSASAKT